MVIVRLYQYFDGETRCLRKSYKCVHVSFWPTARGDLWPDRCIIKPLRWSFETIIIRFYLCWKKFLLCDEKPDQTPLFLKPAAKNVSYKNDYISIGQEVVTDYDADGGKSAEQSNADVGTIVITNATAKWSREQTENALSDIEFSVDPGRLAAIIGSVGSGKVRAIVFQ